MTGSILLIFHIYIVVRGSFMSFESEIVEIIL